MLASVTSLLLLTTAPIAKLNSISDFDVIWKSASKDAAGSMPIGNGEVVLNVWVEESTGDLLFYIARTDAISEISRILKLGRIRIHFDPPRQKSAFEQRLNLQKGEINIQQGDRKIRLFVDAESDTIVVTGESKLPFRASATLECWRNESHTIPKEEQRSAWSVHDAPFPLVESADVFASDPNEVNWYHRNETSVGPSLWDNQSLTGLPGRYDPILHRTFGGKMFGKDFKSLGPTKIETIAPSTKLELKIVTHSAQTTSVAEWREHLDATSSLPHQAILSARTHRWWRVFWDRSYVIARETKDEIKMPSNSHLLRKGVDSNGQNVFPGTIQDWRIRSGALVPIGGQAPFPPEGIGPSPTLDQAFTLSAWITPTELRPGRIFDKLTAGQSDGMLFDTHPGDSLRFSIGSEVITAPKCLKANVRQHVAASFDPATGEMKIYLDAKLVAERKKPEGSEITRGYLLQRYTQAIQGRGKFPIKFNGGFTTVEPAAMGQKWNADWRQWGDSHWFQNLRHMYHPMLASGDFEMMDPFFLLYIRAQELAEARTQKYHGAQGAYFPETMTFFGTYSGGDYGWDRKGLQPKDVQCPWWDDAWNQGPELVCLMLDYWDYTGDKVFLQMGLIPMAESVLKYFDTRFRKDGNGKIILDPTQVVETYWEGVVNDMPAVAGLIAMCDRLCRIPLDLAGEPQREFFAKMKLACPEMPFEEGKFGRELAPAQKYAPKVSNVENGELYAVWPFREVTLQRPAFLEEAKRAYTNRMNRLDTGWGYDGNVAALLGLTDEVARILRIKCRNSNPAYRWPATWGPNFDWLPDQNHGGNLLNTTNLMLMQAEPISQGGKILLLPAWPKKWDVDFKLHAPGKTTVECSVRAGKVVTMKVTPASRRKDVEIMRDFKQ